MKSFLRGALVVVLLAACVGVAVVTRNFWQRSLTPAAVAAAPTAPPKEPVEILELSPEARRNLGLSVKPLKLQSYWRSIQLPGAVVDRPGRSDRGVTSPAVAVVSEIHAYPGDTVRSGERLFTLRVFSEYLQSTQSELFKATHETQLIAEQHQRIKVAAEGGAVPAARVIDLENQLRRQKTAIQAYRQDLLTRGFNPAQIDGVAEGKFVSTIDVVAPPLRSDNSTLAEGNEQPLPLSDEAGSSVSYEIQELKVELGQQVQAGQLLSYLANHRELYVEGYAFKSEAQSVEQAARNGWQVQIEFAEEDAAGWPALQQPFEIRYLANTLDDVSRTFRFFIPLVNQSRMYAKEEQSFVVWRYRPGQRVRLHVPVEELHDVFVVPAAAVVRDGPAAFVFRQNGDLFNRRAVHVLHEDRLNIVLARDSQILPGFFVAQNAAASLNRVLKAQAASGVPAGVHVHADGTTHGAH